MKWITEVKSTKPKFQFQHKEKLLFVGSCFSNNIGEKCRYHKINTVINPYGITFNPLSIEKQLLQLMKGEMDADSIEANQLYHNWSYHTSFSSINKDEFHERCRTVFEEGRKQLKECSVLVLTFGSAYYYRHLETNQVVNNCHKYPSDTFKKELCNLVELVESYKSLIERLEEYNSSLKILLTVSPVRHIKDGLIENNTSKSILSLLCNELVKLDQVDYFPSYEIMMDELRDYRFYGKDMIHPNEMAIEYMWDRFKSVYMAEQDIELLAQIEKIQKSISHKPIHVNTRSYQKFKQNLDSRVQELIAKYPYISIE